MTKCNIIAGWILFVCAASLSAHEPAAVRKVGLPSLDSQARARLVALDARLQPVQSPVLAAGLVTQLANPGMAAGTLAPLLADERNQDRWEQLADDYPRMMIESGESLATVHETGVGGVAWTSEQVRRLCHQRLAALPRASLELYRQRVDAEAKALLDEGRRTRSPAPLRRLADDLFCSRWGDAALDLLGDLAFERGQFDEARHWWRLAAPVEDAWPTYGKSPAIRELHFPGPTIDIARVHAKLILAKMFQGRLDEAGAEIDGFQKSHAQATGAFAGEQGPYHQTLRKTLAALRSERIRNNDEPWSTFGGDPSRNRILSQGLSWGLWEDGPAWRVKLPGLRPSVRNGAPERDSMAQRVAFHPIIVRGQVLVCDHRSVVSYHLKTGVELFRYDLKAAGLEDPGPGVDPALRMPRFTLSAEGERAYVRLGGQRTATHKPGERDGASYLVCLDLSEPERAGSREIWHVAAIADDKAPSWFEGAPLVHEGRIYAALSKLVDRRVRTSICCFDRYGRLRWSREVCDAPEAEESQNGTRYRQELLTLAGGQIVFASHTGAIVAVDAWTGQPTWAVRYPSRGPLTAELEPSPRDLAPCVYADGRVYAAPADSDRLFCIDAVSGRVCWESEGIEIVHLLGVARGRVLAVTRTGLHAFSTIDGRSEWLQPTEGRLPSLGRGLIAGSWLYWPTQDPLLPYRAVTLQEGSQERGAAPASVLPEPAFFNPTLFASMPPGNWAFGHGCLAIAGLSELVVYVPPSSAPNIPINPKLNARLQDRYQKTRAVAYEGSLAQASQAYRELREFVTTQPHADAWHKLIDARVRLLNAPRRRPVVANHVPVDSRSAEPEAAPRGPALPVVRAWQSPGDRVWPANDDVHFISTQPGKIACRTFASGRPIWESRLEFEANWIRRWRDRAIVVGADGVQAIRMKDGQAVWTFAAPSRQYPTASVVRGKPSVVQWAAGIEHAEIWGDTLLVLDDRRQFFRLHLETGAVVWEYAPKAAAQRPLDAAAFSPRMLRVDNRLLVQGIDGQPGFLDDKFVPLGEKSRPWFQPPCLVEKRIVLAGERCRVLGYAAKTGEHLWTYQPEHPGGLTGEPLSLFAEGSVLLALAARNDGKEWIRLDAATGKVFWAVSLPHLHEGLDVGSICIGDALFYYVVNQQLQARSLGDGALKWTMTLPARDAKWKLRYQPLAMTVTPAARSPDDAFTLGFVDPLGGWLQRLTIPGAHGRADTVATPHTMIVSAGGEIFGFRSLGSE